MNGQTPKQINERLKYFAAFNQTMLDIWYERILKLRVYDTYALFKSLAIKSANADSDAVTMAVSWEFNEYGLYQDYGTGREVARGNGGDIGRDKVREARRWFSPKYYSSMMNIRDFMAESLGRQFCAVMSTVLSFKQNNP